MINKQMFFKKGLKISYFFGGFSNNLLSYKPRPDHYEHNKNKKTAKSVVLWCSKHDDVTYMRQLIFM